MSTCWHTLMRIVFPKPSNSAPCWRPAVPPTCVNAWCTPSTCFCRDAAKLTVMCSGQCWDKTKASCICTAAVERGFSSKRVDQGWPRASKLTFLYRCTFMTQQRCKIYTQRLRKWNVAQWLWMEKGWFVCWLEQKSDRVCWYEWDPQVFGQKEGCLESKDKCWAGTSIIEHCDIEAV